MFGNSKSVMGRIVSVNFFFIHCKTLFYMWCKCISPSCSNHLRRKERLSTSLIYSTAIAICHIVNVWGTVV